MRLSLPSSVLLSLIAACFFLITPASANDFDTIDGIADRVDRTERTFFSRADTVMANIERREPGTRVYTKTCRSATRCSFENGTQLTARDLEPADLSAFSSDLDTLAFHAAPDKITTVLVALSVNDEWLTETRVSYLQWGGWMKHARFGSLIAASESYYFGFDEGTTRMSYVVGDRSNSRPVRGSATWNGSVIGFTDAHQPISGDVEVSVAFAARTADFTIDNVEETVTGIEHGDTVFTDIPIDRRGNMSWNGRFTDLETGRYLGQSSIDAAFFGPRHEEIAGIFDRPGYSGAFGAKRQ